MAIPLHDETEPSRRAVRAAREGDRETLERLLDAGAPVDACNEVSLLLGRGADPELPNGRGQTPLAGVAFKGDIESARLLIDAGARVDAAGPDGRTPLMYAAMFDRLELLDLLLKAGADRERADAQGQRPLSLARTMGAQRTLARLQRLYDA